MQDFKHFDPKQAAMDEARGLLEAAARAAMADGSLKRSCPPLWWRCQTT